MNDSLPYRVLYAAEKIKCEKCWHTIRKGALQLAIMVQVYLCENHSFLIKKKHFCFPFSMCSFLVCIFFWIAHFLHFFSLIERPIAFVLDKDERQINDCPKLLCSNNFFCCIFGSPYHYIKRIAVVYWTSGEISVFFI